MGGRAGLCSLFSYAYCRILLPAARADGGAAELAELSFGMRGGDKGRDYAGFAAVGLQQRRCWIHTHSPLCALANLSLSRNSPLSLTSLARQLHRRPSQPGLQPYRSLVLSQRLLHLPPPRPLRRSHLLTPPSCRPSSSRAQGSCRRSLVRRQASRAQVRVWEEGKRWECTG